ncbi:uncharacterized protein BDZ83DRAFT_623690 [Colletotrichum acutatum]|uniref:Uncharacterized protein n=1 Tax=Glomerella acutata TaxID=27357 RepID=A0AAD8UM28_GLOAC|nr:uncharacterized protein BDZ83DRAFT_623690 [Colletotrichum acutatum]KAK1724294.1 hypothetical protein BDZ83DRAFT_623690 [Colletotrichum acutatum]
MPKGSSPNPDRSLGPMMARSSALELPTAGSSEMEGFTMEIQFHQSLTPLPPPQPATIASTYPCHDLLSADTAHSFLCATSLLPARQIFSLMLCNLQQ